MLVTGALALVARVAYVVAQQRGDLLNVYFDAADSGIYRALGESLRSGHYDLAGSPSIAYPPGYPAFLAAMSTLSDSTLAIGIAQALLGAATAVFMACIADRLAGRRAAWATGVIGALYPGIVFWTGYVITETFFCFFLALGLLMTTRTWQQPAIAPAIAAGAAFGVAGLTRSVVLPFAVVLALAGLFDRRFRAGAALGALAMVVVLAPWIVRNLLVVDSPVVTSANSSYVLWRGNHPGVTGGKGGYNNPRDYTNLSFPPGTSDVAMARTYRRAALSWMRSHPGRVLELVPAKLANMLRPTTAGSSTRNKVLTVATYVPLLIAGCWGSVLLLARRRRGAPVIVAYAAYTLIFHSLTFAIVRYRLPLELVMTVTAGVALASLPTSIRSSS